MSYRVFERAREEAEKKRRAYFTFRCLIRHAKTFLLDICPFWRQLPFNNRQLVGARALSSFVSIMRRWSWFWFRCSLLAFGHQAHHPHHHLAKYVWCCRSGCSLLHLSKLRALSPNNKATTLKACSAFPNVLDAHMPQLQPGGAGLCSGCGCQLAACLAKANT